MRSMMVFNYLLEATLFGSVLILLAVAVRMLLRDRLGSRAVYAAWLLVALRLLLPISIPNPFMDEFRPGFSTDVDARPVAAQVRQRLIDTGYSVSSLLPDGAGEPFERFAVHTSGGQTGRWFLFLWMALALVVLMWMLCRRWRFTEKVRRNRVRPLNEEEQALYLQLCERYRVKKPLPVYYVDRLPASCLAGGWRSFIGLPLDTPKEHLSLLLAHQLCHWRVRDPFWGVARCLCCAIHWFNPLVWMAAWLSYRDSEMACDDRVTTRLHDMDRLAYANVIVSAGERENAANMDVSMGASFTDQHLRQRVTAVIRCVRGSRVGIAMGSLLAAAVLVVSFATSESEPLPTIDAVPTVAWMAAAMPVETDMEAIAAARRFLESEFIGEDTSAYAFTARTDGSVWQVDAYREGMYIYLIFTQDGRLQAYDGVSLLDGLVFDDNSYTHRTVTGSVHSYMDAFITALVPETTYNDIHAAADLRAQEVRILLSELVQGQSDVIAKVTLQVEPEVRILSYREIGEK